MIGFEQIDSECLKTKMNKMSDIKGMIKDIKKGDKKAFETVFKEYFPRLSQFALTYVNDITVAENMAQDAFLKLWERHENLRVDDSLVAYLLTITKNNCLDYLKHLQVEIKHNNALLKNNIELELNYHALNRLEIDLLEYNEMKQMVEKIIHSLPAQCRAVFTMSRFENLTNAEIAKKLDIGIKAVEANITRALKIFRKEFKDYLAS